MTDLVLTLIGPDHPGIVDAVAAHGGNWLESRMAHLAGKFAGVLRVEVAEDRVDALKAALDRLQVAGLRIVVEHGAPPDGPRADALHIELLGLDRPGLLHEVSTLLAAHGVNVEELATWRTTAANSGDRMFHADMQVVLPDAVDAGTIRDVLERLAGDLMVDIRLADTADIQAN
jgi:glycine cleavage system regulatory protein